MTMHDKKCAHTSGFTLVELSIVLVIVGLLAGGVLIGKELIRAATIQKAVSQIQTIQTTLAVFQNKYNQLPGDFPNVTDFWPTAIPGNGNGLIDGGFIDLNDPMDGELESYNAWHHLMLAGLTLHNFLPVSVDPTTADPSLALPGALTGTYLNLHYSSPYHIADLPNHYIQLSYIPVPLTSLGTLGYLLAYYGMGTPVGLLPDDAMAIDQKLDDGLPFTGSILSLFPAASGDDQLFCSITASPGINFYNVNSEYQVCVMWIKFNI